MKGWKSDSINTKGRGEGTEIEIKGLQGGIKEKATSKKKKPEREPESEGVGGLGNRWAEGGGEIRMGKGRGGFREEAARSQCRKLDLIGIHGGMMLTSTTLPP